MRRVFVAALAASSLLLIGGTGAAVAQDLPEADPPAAFSPPAPAPVTDVASAEAFAKRYVAKNASRFLDQNRHRVRVINVNASCLQHPAVETRFGCVFTLKAHVIQRRHGWDGWDDKDHSKKHKRFKVRTYGCLGALTIDGGPDVTPSARVRFVECSRISKRDYVAPGYEPKT